VSVSVRRKATVNAFHYLSNRANTTVIHQVYTHTLQQERDCLLTYLLVLREQTILSVVLMTGFESHQPTQKS
jgi:hypothetical protein